MKLVIIISARQQFVKHVTLEIACKNSMETVAKHIRLHYDKEMRQVFSKELKINLLPHYLLNLGGGIHGEQTGKMLIQIGEILDIENPDSVFVYSDTNSALAGDLVAITLKVNIIYAEAGLNSLNWPCLRRSIRLLKDHVSSILFVPTYEAVNNLKKEEMTIGIFRTGDIMSDMIRIALELIKSSEYIPEHDYYFTTIHRTNNTEAIERLTWILNSFNSLSLSVIFPSTRNKMAKFVIFEKDCSKVRFVAPKSYFNITDLLNYSNCLIADSVCMQKEAYNMKGKCVAVRSEPEWVETLTDDFKKLAFEDGEPHQHRRIIDVERRKHRGPLYEDGYAAEDMVQMILNNLN
ncbi:UDP-N-acetylglucosamine 2-epimerase [Fulvivirgaceae bacterium BMA10]|uniref:UDP-N-acetylglucosamine 2-epimerase n=1 Tax=Splendidivirga corallicola TaxID=3051826 RepID=A0ABT8KXX0_9BACT|nr:UDP-N-acetylglucosamine 2-epimerase [Fulvivirgaceae bacterium BMA10]